MSFWQERIKIGSLSYPRFIGGPLDGITDSPFRQLVRDFSRDELLYTEMRHVACVANDRGGVKALRFAQLERPLNYQVSANSTEFIEKACEKIIAAGVDCIDLNIGCPAKNVVCNGAGSALMADIPRLRAIVSLFRTTLPTMPFTVKIRAGFKHKNALEVAQCLQDCGVDAIAIHPRLQTQKFEGRPDYVLAGEVKKAVSIPVIISGGIVNFKMAQLVHEQTGVDGFLIARGMWAKPWKLHEMLEHAQGRAYTADAQLILTYALRHLDLMLEYYGAMGLYNFRKHIPFYIKGFPESSQVRNTLVVSNSVDEVKQELTRLLGAVSG
jgi:tRNA-dihydrouridine synthase B